MELMQANAQWSSRPSDQRYTSLPEMLAFMEHQRRHSRGAVVSSRAIEAVPCPDHKGLLIGGPSGNTFAPTHWAFGQLATLAQAPAGYLRELPAELAADCINFGFKVKRDIDDVGLLLFKDGTQELRAATGPNYGRIWNADIIRTLISHVGDGVTGAWKVPGEFGKAVEVTKENTTLYASDRDCFIFLADEERRIAVPNRRNGQSGEMARGFFLSNSEVGKATLSISTFLFDYVCCNRIVWGAQEFKEVKIRHTSGAPDRWLEEVKPALLAYARNSSSRVLDTVREAQRQRIDNLDTFLANRFTKGQVEGIKSVHLIEEGRPIETLWDATTAVTAYARGIEYQDSRVELERKGGLILEMAQ